MKQHKPEELYKLLKDGKDVDSDIHSEMRSNLLLVSGDHWKNVHKKTHQRVRESSLPDEVKIKLTKNHLGTIQDKFKAGVKALTPGVQPFPYNESDMQDVKDAEISKSVLSDINDKQGFKEKSDKWIDSFLDIGECWAETIFDPNDGDIRGFEQAVDKKGNPLFRAPDGSITVLPFDLITQEPFEPVQTDVAIFSGRIKSNVVWPMNVIRPVGCETFTEAPWIGIEVMMGLEDIKRLIPEDAPNAEALKAKITETQETTFKVFDCSKGEYLDAKDQAMIRKMYWKPCVDYPRGYYAFLLEEEVLVDGELPFGLFPLTWKINQEIPTSPRGRSLIKRLRPGQVEINRLASSQAYHQIVLGDDKIITKSGSLITKGQRFDGIRQIIVQGDDPTIMSGRSGEQFAPSLVREIEDLYKIANLEYNEKDTSAQEINVQIYQSMNQKAKYSPYASKIEEFLVEVNKKQLELAKHTLDEHDIIKMAGKREYLNVEEFKRLDDIGYAIKMLPINGDIESVMGRQLAITQTLQYAGSQLPPHLLGKLLKHMPFLNKDQIFSHLTNDEDIITNDMLALERGQYRPAKKEMKHEYMIEMLTHRMSKADYEALPMIVKDMYERRVQEHRQLLQENAQQLKALQDRMIPTSGPLIKVDLYQNVMNDKGQMTQKVQKMAFPMSALLDLATKMQAQGNFTQITQNLDAQTQIGLLEGAFGGPQQNQQSMGANPGQGQVLLPPQQQGVNAMMPGGMNG